MPGMRTCGICGRKRPDLVPTAVLRPALVEILRRDRPDDAFLCLEDLNAVRSRYIQSLVEAEKGEHSSLEQEVLASLRDHEILSRNVEVDHLLTHPWQRLVAIQQVQVELMNDLRGGGGAGG